jgi:hypothetical protein
MTQEERWLIRYNEVVDYIVSNHRNPSKHRIEEHDMLNWLKANRKALNAGNMKLERLEMFRRLLSLMEEYKCKKRSISTHPKRGYPFTFLTRSS